MQCKQQLCIHFAVEWLFGECEYTTQSKSSFCCHFIDTKGAVWLLIFTSELVLVHVILTSIYSFVPLILI